MKKRALLVVLDVEKNLENGKNEFARINFLKNKLHIEDMFFPFTCIFNIKFSVYSITPLHIREGKIISGNQKA